MLKKTAALFLCVILMLSLVVPAFAAYGPEEPEFPPETEPVTEAETEPETATEATDDEWVEPKADVEFYEDGYSRLADENPLLGASGGTVNVTAKLPSGVSGSGYIYIYLCRPAEKDSSGKVTDEVYTWYSKKADISGSGASATFNEVQPGDYFVGIYSYYLVAPGMVCSSSTYAYNADGSLAADLYTATPFSVSNGSTVNKTVTLKKAERVISGTLRFSSSVSSETQISVYANPYNGGNQSRLTLTVPAGAKSVPFSIGVEKAGDYYVRFNNMAGTYSISLESSLTDVWREYAFFNTYSGDITGLDIQADKLLSGGTGSDGVHVEMTVQLPEATTERRQYRLIAGSDNRGSWSSWNTVDEGSTTVAANFTLPKGEDFVFYYEDVTNCSGAYNNSGNMRFAAAGGITTVKEKAKVFNFTEDTASVTITEPACYKVTGTISRGDYYSGSEIAAYAWARFDDGELYGARAYFGRKETSAAYTLYIPKTQSGKTATMYATGVIGLRTNQTDVSSKTEESSFTLNGDTAGKSFQIGKTGHTVSGTLTLPVAVPSGGASVYIESNGGAGVRYVLKSGATSLNFSYTDYCKDETWFYATLNGMSGVSTNASTRVSPNGNGDYTGVEFSFAQLALITGTVYLPEGVSNVGANIWYNSSYRSGYISILKGKTSAAYTLEVPVGMELYCSMHVEYETGGAIVDNYYYLNSNWSFTTYNEGGPTVTGDRSGVDLTLEAANSISGKLVVPGATSFPAKYDSNRNSSVRIDYKSGDGNWTGSWVTLNDDGSWFLKIPKDLTGDVLVRAYVNASSTCRMIPDGTFYYTGDSSTFSYHEDEAVAVTLTAKGASGLVIAVPRAEHLITCTVPRPEGYTGNISGSVIVEMLDDEGNVGFTYGGAFYISDNTSNSNYSKDIARIAITAGETMTKYRICVYTNSTGLQRNTYLTADGGATVRPEEAKVFKMGDNQHTVTLMELRGLLETPHNITSGTYTYTFSYPGATQLRFRFTGGNGEEISYTYSKNGGEETSNTGIIYNSSNIYINGDTVTFTYTVDSDEPIYGFAVDEITIYGEFGPTAACVFKNGGDLKTELRATGGLDVIATIDRAKETILAAVYDSAGKMLECKVGEFYVAGGDMTRYHFDLAANSDAATLKLFILSANGTPLCAATVPFGKA